MAKFNFYRRSRRHNIVLCLLLIIFIFSVAAYGWKITRPKENTPTGKAQTTSKLKTAQDSFDDGDDKTNAKRNHIKEGGAIDNNNPVVAPPASQQTKSESGIITIYTPSKKSVIKNGAMLSGKSSVDPVYFRLVDSDVGIIAQGPLNVVDGNFSSTLQFTPQSNSGVLRVYSVDRDSDREVNLVQINVSF